MYLVFKGVLSPKFEIVKAKNETKNFPAKVSFLPDVRALRIEVRRASRLFGRQKHGNTNV